MPEKILIDTDPGIDDAFAILYALKSPDFDVLGLTTVYGNASIEQTTHNARALVDMGGKPCPVAQGAADPLVIERRAFPAMVHGEDGFGVRTVRVRGRGGRGKSDTSIDVLAHD